MTLDELIYAVRAECGDSTNQAMGLEALPAYTQLLNRIQDTYYQDFDWPKLIINRDEAVLAGERYYTFNDDVNFDRIFKASVLIGGQWTPLHYGIEPEHYNASNPELGQTETSPRRWVHYEGNQFEIWPMPSAATTIRFRCIRSLPKMTLGTDECLLDSTLLILTAAAEILARKKSEDAKLKLSMATSHYNRLKGRSQKTRMFVTSQLPTSPQGSCIRVPR